MSGIGASNPNLIAKAYDTNKDGLVSDNLAIRKDPKTAQALGGGDKVSVDQLANALRNDSIVIRNGEAFAPMREVRIPALFQDVESVHSIASNALTQTSSWNHTYIPERPQQANFAGPAQYNDAVKNYNESVRQYRNDIKADRSILVNSLQNISMTTNNPQIRDVASNAMRNVALNDIMGFALDQRNHEIVSQDRSSLRQALSTINDMSQFTQPRETIATLNKEISDASSQIDREKSDINTKAAPAIKNLEAARDKASKSWFFGGMRANSDQKDIDAIKSLDPKSQEDKLAGLARKNYENGIRMAEGFSIQDAKDLSREALPLSREIVNVHEVAKDGAKLIEKNAKK